MSFTRPGSRRSRFGLWLLRNAHVASEWAKPVGKRFIAPNPKLRYIPTLRASWSRSLRSPARPWGRTFPPIPSDLLSGAAVGLLPDVQQRAAVASPLHDFFAIHPEAGIPFSSMWLPLVANAPRTERARRRHQLAQVTEPTATSACEDPAALTRELKGVAAGLGFSALGIAEYDSRYTFAEYAGRQVGDRVIVGILEQNYPSTQRIPSMTSERAALATYAQLEERMTALSNWLQEHGYRARPEGFIGESLYIAYAVKAGLGQLGLNGQLLTPQAGSRCRINVLTTNAPLDFDAPVDFGIEGVCDRCQICVRRCPAGAIPAVRTEHRGVIKAKLNTKRCLPLVGQAAGCSICMKVCPVQRFGLAAVVDEFTASGRILGKDTDDLEGYDWPLDGQHYGPSATPRVSRELIQPPGFDFDPQKTAPAQGERPPARPGMLYQKSD